MASAINMITVINDDARGANYDLRNLTKLIKIWNFTLHFTTIIFFDVYSTGHRLAYFCKQGWSLPEWKSLGSVVWSYYQMID